MQGKRLVRVNQLIKEEISMILQRQLRTRGSGS
jgi:ribosome-binding factor A